MEPARHSVRQEALLLLADWHWLASDHSPEPFKCSSLRRAILAPAAKAEFITLKTTALCLLFAHVVYRKALKATRLQEAADGGLEGDTGVSSS